MKTIKKSRIIAVEIINREGDYESFEINTFRRYISILPTEYGVELHTKSSIETYPWARVYRLVHEKYDAPLDAELERITDAHNGNL